MREKGAKRRVSRKWRADRRESREKGGEMRGE